MLCTLGLHLCSFSVSQTLRLLWLLEPHRDLVLLLSAVSDKHHANQVLKALSPHRILKTN